MTLAQSYATATANHLFYPHAKAFFRQCTLLQRNSSSFNSSSKAPKVTVAALHALPKTATVAAVAAAAAEEGAATETPDSPDSELRSPSSSRSSDSSPVSQHTSATPGDALTWALMQWMPAIRAEQVGYRIEDTRRKHFHACMVTSLFDFKKISFTLTFFHTRASILFRFL